MRNIFERAKNLKDNIEIFGLSGILYTIEEDFEDAKADVMGDIEQVGNFLLRGNARDRLKETDVRELSPGDVVAVTRKQGYQHFGVYIGDNKVIHFASPNGDWSGGRPVIHEAPFENFLRDAESFEILIFDEKREKPLHVLGVRPVGTIFATVPLAASGITLIPFLTERYRDAQYHLYTPEETVARAKEVARKCEGEGSKFEMFINGHSYNLVFNNCEHFAIWCKTGVHESRQVDRVLSILTGYKI